MEEVHAPFPKKSRLLQRTIRVHEKMLQNLHEQQPLVEFQLQTIQKRREEVTALHEELIELQLLDLLFQIIKDDDSVD